MTHRTLSYAVTATLMLFGGAGTQFAQERLRWSELEPAVTGKTLTVALSTGESLYGRVLDVGATTLWMNVKNSSAPRDFPKGKRALPRRAVSHFEIRTSSTSGLRKVLAGVGVGLGTTAVVAALLVAGAARHGDLSSSSASQDPKTKEQELKAGLLVLGGISVAAGTALGIAAARGHGGDTVRIINVVPEDDRSSESGYETGGARFQRPGEL